MKIIEKIICEFRNKNKEPSVQDNEINRKEIKETIPKTISGIANYVNNHREIQNNYYYDFVYSRPNDKIDFKRLNIAFIVPEPKKGSGGQRNIYRIAKYLRDFGHEITIYYIKSIENADSVKNKINEWFFDISDIPCIAYNGSLGYHDVVFATWWETAYILRDNHDKVSFSFYLVQDFEPYYYPRGSNYIMAENTYKMGFHHICIGDWCKGLLLKNYQCDVESFQFPINNEIYNMNVRRVKQNKNIVFFARPDMSRRCFEIGVEALRLISAQRPDIELIMYGSQHLYNIGFDFNVTILGILELKQLAELYRNADLGLAFSTANASFVPYEMMSCGCPVVDIETSDAIERYGGDENNVFIFSPEPDILAKEIISIIDDEKILRCKAVCAKDWVSNNFSSETEVAGEIEDIIKNIIMKSINHNKLKWLPIGETEFVKKRRNKIIIMCPWDGNPPVYGDYHYCIALKKYFERRSFDVEIRLRNDWYLPHDKSYVLVLRGLFEYKPRKDDFNIIWIISHPTEISVGEFNSYNLIFVASKQYVKKIEKTVEPPVYTLEQCTDHELFYRPISNKKNGKLLFVGIHHPEGRPIITDVLPTDFPLDIYGGFWHGNIDEKFIVADAIDNKDLPNYYNSYSVVLNDHRPGMEQEGFLSNRVYDVYAAGGFVISKYIDGLEGIIEGLIYYKTKEELKTLIKLYMSDECLIKEHSEKMQKIVLSEHTFEKRVDEIIKILNNIWM